MQKLKYEQIEGSGFVSQYIENVILENDEINDIQSPSSIGLSEKETNIQSDTNLQSKGPFCFFLFLWCVSADKFPVDENTHRLSNYSVYANALKPGDLQFPMKVKDNPKLEKLTSWK